MDNKTKKRWYQKKRYMLPLGLFCLLVLVSILSPANPQQSSIQPSMETKNQVKSDTVKLPAEIQPLQLEQEQPQQNQNVPTNTPPPAPKSESQLPTTKAIEPVPPQPTAAQTNCDPNYSGCVPIASDVDCAGGRGNGPAYVRGPVQVIGSDIYGLDRDGNGIACE